MAVLIDPPLWPAHGTVFSHLVSDTSLAELHDFAERLGAHPRAFDADHYDVPERLYARAVSLGAEAVSSTELVRRLIASGLRRPKARRETDEAALAERLRGLWEDLLPGAPEVVEDLLDRWDEPHRRYHDLRHLAACLAALDRLETAGVAVTRQARLAAWFHDAVYDGAPGADEEASARLAEEALADRLPAEDVSEVARLVRLTAGHSPSADDAAGAALCDADLSVLAAPASRYAAYLQDVRIEYFHLSAEDFRRGRRSVVEALLSKQPLFTSAAAISLWEKDARRNLEGELR
ncbi:MAG: DUF4031 domain-containing protein [Micrococcales bacterium]|nr:DUF4031 domain-containing protein [Micrococcales bacterium]